MKAGQVFRWTGYAFAGLALLATVLAAVVYAWTETRLERNYEFVARTVMVPADAASIARGEKVARTRGCLGCHGKNGEGQYFVDIPWVARLPAPNLTRLVHEWTVPELDRSIRQGVRENGTSVFGMPSAMYQHLADEDFGALIAYLRSLPRSDNNPQGRFVGLPARALILQGELAPEREVFAEFLAVRPAPGELLEHGKYLAQTTCSECHGPNLHGWAAADPAPSLLIVAGYTLEAFQHLMTHGESSGGHPLGLMRAVAIARFAHYTPEEVAAIHAYLTSPGFFTLPPRYAAVKE
jgi:mono/diheme cytochrome c family protein